MSTKLASLDRAQANTLIHHFLDQFKECCNNSAPLNAADLDKYLAHNIQMSSNGQLVCHTTEEYHGRLEKYKEKYSHIEFKYLMDEPLIADNNAIINYSVKLTGKPKQAPIELNIMAIATIEDGKISKWSQVVHEKGSSHWDS
jgi:hypothetical protein